MKLSYDSKLYPKKLRNIKEPPSQIFAIGNVNVLNDFGIAIIGSRNCTTYGTKMTKIFTRDLVKYNINIISGLALGIDKCAHTSAIKEQGNTIAVLPCGFNNIYPKENEFLVDEIVNSGGCIITEYEEDVEANSKRFLERNRIISGISDGILIVEGGYRSGTSVTAKIAKNQDKKIFCVPSSLENPKGLVPNRLIKEGAILVRNEKDIVDNYNGLVKKTKNNNNAKVIRNDVKFNKLYSILNNDGMYIDEIIIKSKLKIDEVNYQLIVLELNGYIEQLPGRKYRRR